MRFSVVRPFLWWRSTLSSQNFKKTWSIQINLQQKQTLVTASSDDEGIEPIYLLARQHLSRTAIEDINGSHSYQDVLCRSLKLANLIRHSTGGKTGERIGFLCSSDVTYVQAQWACWASGNIGNKFLMMLLLNHLTFALT